MTRRVQAVATLLSLGFLQYIHGDLGLLSWGALTPQNGSAAGRTLYGGDVGSPPPSPPPLPQQTHTHPTHLPSPVPLGPFIRLTSRSNKQVVEIGPRSKDCLYQNCVATKFGSTKAEKDLQYVAPRFL